MRARRSLRGYKQTGISRQVSPLPTITLEAARALTATEEQHGSIRFRRRTLGKLWRTCLNGHDERTAGADTATGTAGSTDTESGRETYEGCRPAEKETTKSSTACGSHSQSTECAPNWAEVGLTVSEWISLSLDEKVRRSPDEFRRSFSKLPDDASGQQQEQRILDQRAADLEWRREKSEYFELRAIHANPFQWQVFRLQRAGEK